MQRDATQHRRPASFVLDRPPVHGDPVPAVCGPVQRGLCLPGHDGGPGAGAGSPGLGEGPCLGQGPGGAPLPLLRLRGQRYRPRALPGGPHLLRPVARGTPLHQTGRLHGIPGAHPRPVSLLRPKKLSPDFHPTASWKCRAVVGCSAAGHSLAGWFTEALAARSRDAATAVMLAFSRAFFPELLLATAGIATPDSVTLQLLRRRLLPPRDHF